MSRGHLLADVSDRDDADPRLPHSSEHRGDRGLVHSAAGIEHDRRVVAQTRCVDGRVRDAVVEGNAADVQRGDRRLRRLQV